VALGQALAHITTSFLAVGDAFASNSIAWRPIA
jgi:hypothetical protein